MSMTEFLDFNAAAAGMATLIRDKSRTKAMVAAVAGLTNSLAPGDYQSEAAVLARACRDGIRYMSDPSTEDLFKSPELTWNQGNGDCNNKVVLFGSLARAAGFPVRIVFLFDKRQPDLAVDFPVHVLAAIDVYKGEREIESWWFVELTPLPDRVDGFPRHNVSLGVFELPPTYSQVTLDVDDFAVAA